MADQYFAIKTRNPVTVGQILNKEADIELSGINVMQEAMRKGTMIFIVLGGDKPSWETGLIGIGTISKEPYDYGYKKRNYKIRIDMKVLLDAPIKRDALVPYKDCYGIIAIGPQLKGEPNQALTTMTGKQAAVLMRAMAELCPGAVEDIKALVDSDLEKEIFGPAIKMVEVPFEYKENETSAIERYISSKRHFESEPAVSKYKNMDLDQRKQAFVEWMKKKSKTGATEPVNKNDLYSDNVIYSYATFLTNRAAQLTDFPYEHTNLFYYVDPGEFKAVQKAAMDAPNYPEVNQKCLSKGFGPAMKRYSEFLDYLTADSHEGSDEVTGEGSLMRNCLEIRKEPRAITIHPLNFIIYGAPGTGKTYSTAEYALAIIENRAADLSKKTVAERKAVMAKYNGYVKEGKIVFTTFHQSYGYEEFIQGLRPDTDSEGMSFKTVDGTFKKIADKALNDQDSNYVIIIDEINRANISKVFGELITLIEDDKRWGEINETCATLQSGDIFAVPNNLYIVGTMNSADKSISLIDAALRRRFSFIEQQPDDSLVADSVLRKVLHEMNILLAKELDSTDLLVGHSYFMNRTADDICDILNNNIILLLYEYFYDNRKKVANILDEVIRKSGAGVEIEDYVIGRLRVKIKDKKDDSEQV